jgi:hypothetical protein
MKSFLIILALCFAPLVNAQSILLEDFSAIPSGALSGTWIGQATVSNGIVTIGGSATQINGWSETQAINATGMNFLAITAKIESGNATYSLTFVFNDSNLNSYSVTTLASNFSSSFYTTVYVPVSWTGGIDKAQITDWNMGGGGVGSNAFAWSFDNVALVVSAVPEPATYAAIFGLAALGFGAVRRRRKA